MSYRRSQPDADGQDHELREMSGPFVPLAVVVGRRLAVGVSPGMPDEGALFDEAADASPATSAPFIRKDGVLVRSTQPLAGRFTARFEIGAFSAR